MTVGLQISATSATGLSDVLVSQLPAFRMRLSPLLLGHS